MESDIVARLRGLASEFPTLDGIMDSEWTNAADEIERLRRHYSEAEKDHVECVAEYHDAKMEIERLRARVAELEEIGHEH